MMKTTNELKAALHMVQARLEADPESANEWRAIWLALRDSTDYAFKRCQQSIVDGKISKSFEKERS